MIPIADLRLDYKLQTLDIQDINQNPILQFQKWFEEALNSQIREPNAMTLATASLDGVPNARIVLLKTLDNRGFTFYTNFDSDKGKELLINPKAALVFNWLELERQVRVQGHIAIIDDKEATQYFQSRPKSSQIGAWASPQSQIIEDRVILETKKKILEKKYETELLLPKPPNWGGFLVIPHKIEFWQGRSSRLHDRICFTKTDNSNHHWKIERLAP
jgi:pyridoxamine 5'-phosphate oxidase